MGDVALNRLLDALTRQGVPAPRQANGGPVRCPAHDDDRPSLNITSSGDRVLVHCHAGCDTVDVLAALDLTWADLFDAGRPQDDSWAPGGKTVDATYDYIDEHNRLLFQVVRTRPKDFLQRRPDPASKTGWKWSTDGVRRVLYRLPKIGRAIASGEPVWLVEGEKDVHALEAAGVTATCNPGGAGPGKWRRDYTNTLAGAHLVIVADADDTGRAHAARIAQGVTSAAASVRVVEAAAGKDAHDHLAAGRTIDEFVDCEVPAAGVGPDEPAPVPPAAGDPPSKEIDRRGPIAVLADEILIDHHFAQDQGGQLYVYRHGVYRPNGRHVIQQQAKTLLARWDREKKWSSRVARDLEEWIRVDSPRLWERPPLDQVNVTNGIVDVRTGELHPHTPRFYSPIQIPVAYNPAATCPLWENFAGQVLPDDTQHLPWELVGWLMIPATHIQKAILLLGEGSNGKSTLLRAVITFLGPENTSAVPLHKLEADRFATSRLVGKLANICADLPSAHLDTTSTFKAIVGGDTIPAERKHVDQFEIRPYARLVFSANHPPRSADGSHAFFRRWLVVPFPHTFEEGEDGWQPGDTLDAALAHPDELSGVLNRALDALRRILPVGRLTESLSMWQAWEDFRATTDPLSVWLDRNTVRGAELHVVKDDLRRAYNADAEKHGRPLLSDITFAKTLRRLRPDLTDARPRIGGQPRWAWIGIALRAASGESDPSDPSDPSKSLPRAHHGTYLNGHDSEKGARDRPGPGSPGSLGAAPLPWWNDEPEPPVEEEWIL